MNELSKKTIAITREETDANDFVSLVRMKGGTPITLSTIKVVAEMPEKSLECLALLRSNRYDYCLFLSAQAVRILFQMNKPDLLISSLGTTTVISVGPKTRSELEKFGVQGSIMPKKYSSKGIIEMFLQMQPSGKRVLIPRSKAADNTLASALRELKMHVDEQFIYNVQNACVTEGWRGFASQLVQKKVDLLIFTSPSTVRAFFEILSQIEPMRSPLNNLTRVVALGSLTGKELVKYNVQFEEAPVQTVKDVVEFVSRRIAVSWA